MKAGAQQRESARRQPVQARSRASVFAILDAAVQILSTRRTTHFTTKAVAARAGVSVGSMYQYFPNKQAIVTAVIARRAEEVTSSFEEAARQQCGRSLEDALRVLAATYFAAKFHEPQLSKRLYSSLDHLGGAHLLRPFRERMVGAVESVLRQAPDAAIGEVHSTARTIWSAMTGTVRSLLEAERTPHYMTTARRELQEMIVAYVQPTMLKRTRRDPGQTLEA